MFCGMTGMTCRIAYLAARFMIAFAVLLAVMGSPASAHTGGPNETAFSIQQDSKDAEAFVADTCCHKAGTCVVTFLPVSPAMTPLDAEATALEHGFAPVRHASLASAKDPPPPRA